MAPPRKEEISRMVRTWIAKHQAFGHLYPEAYEVDIKMHRIDIPDYVREAISQDRIDEIVAEAMDNALESFSDSLLEAYPWLRNWAKEGRSGGWLVLYTDDPVLDDRGDVVNARKARKRLRDLAEIHRRRNRAQHDFRSLMQEPDFWYDHGVTGPRRQDWRPRR